MPRFIAWIVSGYARPSEGLQGMSDQGVTPSGPLTGVSRGGADAALDLRAAPPDPDVPPVAGSATQRWWRDTRRRRMLASADIIAAAIATVVAVPALASVTWALFFLPLWVVVAKL